MEDKRSISSDEIEKDVDESSMVEFLNNVSQHICWRRARSSVERELKQHILDQKDAFERDGISSQQALDRAVKEMGNPHEIGSLMNRIHRPEMSWTLLVMVMLASLVGIALQGALYLISSQGRVSGNLPGAADIQISSYSLNNQIKYSVMGIALMLIIRLLDYRRVKSFITAAAAVFCAFLILILCFQTQAGAGVVWFSIAGIHFNLCIIILLAVPMFALLIYNYKGGGYAAIIKLVCWSSIFIAIACMIPAFSSAVIVAASNLILLCISVAKGWFNASRKIVFISISAILALCILYFAVIICSDTIGNALLPAYRIERLRYYFGVADNMEEAYDYQGRTALEIISGSRNIGYDASGLADAMSKLSGLGSDFTLAGLTAAFGVNAGIFAVLMLLAITAMSFKITAGQSDEMGKILGAGCGLVFLFETIVSVLTSLHIIPGVRVILPFISQGGSQIFVMYILTGLVLSIQRNKSIAMYGTDGGMENAYGVYGRSFEIARLKITVEKV